MVPSSLGPSVVLGRAMPRTKTEPAARRFRARSARSTTLGEPPLPRRRVEAPPPVDRLRPTPPPPPGWCSRISRAMGSSWSRRRLTGRAAPRSQPGVTSGRPLPDRAPAPLWFQSTVPVPEGSFCSPGAPLPKVAAPRPYSFPKACQAGHSSSSPAPRRAPVDRRPSTSNVERRPEVVFASRSPIPQISLIHEGRSSHATRSHRP